MRSIWHLTLLFLHLLFISPVRQLPLDANANCIYLGFQVTWAKNAVCVVGGRNAEVKTKIDQKYIHRAFGQGNFSKSASQLHKLMVNFTKLYKPKEPEDEEDKCGRLWNEPLSKIESEGAEKIEKNEINDDLNYNFPDNETLILDGCFFCPLMIDYEVKSIDIWQHTIVRAGTTKRPNNLHFISSKSVKLTKTGFTAVKKLYPYFVETSVYFEIWHNCSLYGQDYWMYIVVDQWPVNRGLYIRRPFVYPTTRIELCTTADNLNCRTDRLDNVNVILLKEYLSSADCYKDHKPDKRCYSDYNITDTTKIKRSWEEIKKIKKEKTRFGHN